MAAGFRGVVRKGCGQSPLRRLACLLLCVFLPCATARAQEKTKPEAESFPERLQRTARGVTGQLKRLNLYPYVTSLATGGGAAPGLAYFDPRLGGGSVGIYGSVSHSIKDDALKELRLGRMPHEPGKAPRRRLDLEWLPTYVQAPLDQERFFAYGRVSQLDLEAGRYLRGYSDPLQQRSVDAVLGYRLARGLAIQGRAGLLAVSPGEEARTLGRIYDPSLEVPGQAWKRDYLRLTSELVWDTRERPWHPQGGGFVSLRLESYQGIGETPGFRRVALDARRYLPLADRHLLALRAAGSLASTGGVPVPYYLQYSLGGGRLLRSYPEHRFSGDRIYAVSAEYRFQAARWLELAAFVDGGAASGGFAGLDSFGFRTSTGVGARLTTSDKVLLRFDLATGAEGTRFNAKIGLSF